MSEEMEVEKKLENPEKYFLDKKGNISDNFVLKLSNGLKIKMRPSEGIVVPDREIFKEVILDGVYDKEEFIPEKADTVVDIGAHIGMFSIKSAKKVSDQGEVFAFEPYSRNYKMLEINKKLNGLDNLNTLNFAVGSHNGKAKLSVSKENTGAHSIVYGNGHLEEVEVKALHNIVNGLGIKHIDLVKMDCEGSEYEIIPNMDQEVLDKIDKIVLEEHRTEKTKKKFDKHLIENFLKDNGFQVQKTNRIYYPNEGVFWLLFAKRN